MYLRGLSFIIVVLTLAYLKMDKDKIWPDTCSLREQGIGHKINVTSKNIDINSKSEAQCLRTHSMTCELKRVSIQNKRKQTLPELAVYNDSSSKIVRRDVDSVREKRKKTIDDTRAQQLEYGNASRFLKYLPQLQKKDKDGDT